MFTTLHELAKKATLMITVAAEGDGQLRVNVTPMPFDTKAKHNLPQPLSLLATPVEFDADFVAALSTWQAPKRSLIQQAQDAAGGAAPAAAPALPAPKSEAKSDSKSEKPVRKARAGKGGEDDKKVDAVPEAGAAAGEAAAAADQVMAASAGGPEVGAGPDAALDQGAEQVVGDAVADAPASTGPEGGQAPAEKAAAAPEEAAGDEPVDKFTLDLF